MDPLILFSILIAIYLILLFFDSFFKSCMLYPYDAFLRKTGLTINFLRINWYTTAFNRTIFRIASIWKNFFIYSFNIGVIVSVCLIPIGIIILLMNLFHQEEQLSSINKNNNAAIYQLKLEILLPGINLPLDEVGFYMITLLICSVVHELGHALAAVLDEVPVLGFGFQCYFCIPVAYTELSQDHLNSLKCFKKLRVLCGGIWHNIILSGIFYLIYSSINAFGIPFYKLNEGVIVTGINKNSPLLGDKGLYKNDVVIQINDCPTLTYEQYYKCLLKSIQQKPGFCVSSNFIHLHDESVRVSHGVDGLIECCDSTNFKQTCFELAVDDLSNDEPLEIPQHVCLDIRKTIEDSNEEFCYGTSCERGFCMKPLLRNITTIMILKRKSNTDVIYVGHPSDLAKTVGVSQFIPQSFLSSEFGESILLFLKYNIIFSLGLGLVNAIPVFGLDGYYIAQTILNNVLINKISERSKREFIVLVITSLGTLLFLGSMLKSVWTTLKTMF